ncbi:Endo-1,4-beta-xylanase C [Hypsizygus marmoreus]|uniref:Beta-xylanase n=1 Tax=Hypsizygus marmoreus TaxID=39966 RepID=A0A369JZE6_HYPMA|nr:Endo-1,4-beta-xylanase C [Hypsizygus marmoreus]
MKLVICLASLLALVPLTTAQSGAWGQCGGIGWTGPTTCVAGYTCTVGNPYYSQCLPNGTGTTPTSPTGTTTSPASTGTSNAGLSAVALAAGKKYFGSATDNPELTDTAYVAGLSNVKDFNQITPGNSMKWDATEPSRGTFTFSGGDAVVALAKKNGQLVRGHNCVWYNQLPSWVSSGGFNNATLTSILQNHCGTLVGHYKGQIIFLLWQVSDLLPSSDSWDVVNEPFNDDGTWRSMVFYNTMGTSYVSVALQAARAADPAAKLYINDYNIEGTGAKSTAMVNLVKSLKAAERLPCIGSLTDQTTDRTIVSSLHVVGDSVS